MRAKRLQLSDARLDGGFDAIALWLAMGCFGSRLGAIFGAQVLCLAPRRCFCAALLCFVLRWVLGAALRRLALWHCVWRLGPIFGAVALCSG